MATRTFLAIEASWPMVENRKGAIDGGEDILCRCDSLAQAVLCGWRMEAAASVGHGAWLIWFAFMVDSLALVAHP